MTPAQIAARFGCTPEQARKQLHANAAQLRELADKAEKTRSGKLRGFTAAEYRERAEAFTKAADQ